MNSSSPPPFQAPDFIVATPAGLLSFLESAGGSYGPLWTMEGFQARIKHVVVDEADLMLTPAYYKALDRVLLVSLSRHRLLLRRTALEPFSGLDRFGSSPASTSRLPLLRAWWRAAVPLRRPPAGGGQGV